MVGEIERVLAALERGNVRYLVVGGVVGIEAGRPLDREDAERLREMDDDDR